MSNDIPKLNTYVRSLGGKFNPYDNVSYQMRMSQQMRAGANIFAGQVNVRNMPYTYYESVQAGVDPNDTAQKAFTGVQLGLQFGEAIMNLLNQLRENRLNPLFNLLMLVMKSKKTIFKCVNGLKHTICRYLQLLPKLIIFPAERFKKFWPILGKNFPEMSCLLVLRTDFIVKTLLNIYLIYVNNK